MSQINDALRRASDAAKAPGYSPLAPPPLPERGNEESSEMPLPITNDMLVPRLIPETDEPEGSSKKPIIAVVLVILGTIGFGGYRLWRKFDRTSGWHVASVEKKLALMDRAMALAQSNATRHAVASTNFTASAPVADTQKTAVAETVVPRPAPVVPPRPVTPAVVANSTPAKFPPLRLQSIFYRPSNPSVMINGKLLCIADEIQGVLVADIQPSSVTLVLSGYTNVLTLR